VKSRISLSRPMSGNDRSRSNGPIARSLLATELGDLCGACALDLYVGVTPLVRDHRLSEANDSVDARNNVRAPAD
jgi:hypothetical protein